MTLKQHESKDTIEARRFALGLPGAEPPADHPDVIDAAAKLVTKDPAKTYRAAIAEARRSLTK